MHIQQIKSGLNKTIFSLGYAADINADLYSVYLGESTWGIYILERGSSVSYLASVGTFKGQTLEQYMEGK